MIAAKTTAPEAIRGMPAPVMSSAYRAAFRGSG
jgi:hypothetical protein